VPEIVKIGFNLELTVRTTMVRRERRGCEHCVQTFPSSKIAEDHARERAFSYRSSHLIVLCTSRLRANCVARWC